MQQPNDTGLTFTDDLERCLVPGGHPRSLDEQNLRGQPLDTTQPTTGAGHVVVGQGLSLSGFYDGKYGSTAHLVTVATKVELHAHHPQRRLERMEEQLIALSELLQRHLCDGDNSSAWSALENLNAEYKTYVEEARKTPIYHGGLEVDTSRWPARS